jgi:hypothetical protein
MRQEARQNMTPITAIVILGLVLGLTTVFQALVFFWLLRTERRFVKDLLNRLASRSVGEYAATTKVLEDARDKAPAEATDETGQPIPIW